MKMYQSPEVNLQLVAANHSICMTSETDDLLDFGGSVDGIVGE